MRKLLRESKLFRNSDKLERIIGMAIEGEVRSFYKVTTDDNTNEERLERLRVLELRGSVWPEQWLKFLQEGGQGCPAR